MIETKEQYELWKLYARYEPLVETIEALRDVAKAAEFAKYMAAGGFDTALNNELDKLRVVLEALPDWITE